MAYFSELVKMKFRVLLSEEALHTFAGMLEIHSSKKDVEY